MDHDAASAALADLARGRLSPEEADAVRAHVVGCPECRGLHETMLRVGSAIGAHGADLFTEHPSPEDLARYVLTSAELSTDAIASISRHVHACPACAREASLARAANATAWTRTWRSLLSPSGSAAPSGRWLSPALAILAVALAYPAYMGIVRYPAERAAGHRAAAEAESLRGREAEFRGSLGEPGGSASRTGSFEGGAATLILSGVTRGAGGRIPMLRVHQGQTSVPVILDYEIAAAGARTLDRRVRVGIIRLADQSIVWTREERARDLWDSENQVVSLLVPAAALTPGEYRLEIGTPGAPASPHEFAARFRVAAAPR